MIPRSYWRNSLWRSLVSTVMGLPSPDSRGHSQNMSFSCQDTYMSMMVLMVSKPQKWENAQHVWFHLEWNSDFNIFNEDFNRFYQVDHSCPVHPPWLHPKSRKVAAGSGSLGRIFRIWAPKTAYPKVCCLEERYRSWMIIIGPIYLYIIMTIIGPL